MNATMMLTAKVMPISRVYLGLKVVRKMNTSSITKHSRDLLTNLSTSFWMSSDTS